MRTKHGSIHIRIKTHNPDYDTNPELYGINLDHDIMHFKSNIIIVLFF